MSAENKLKTESRRYWKVPNLNCSKSSVVSYKPGVSIKSDIFTVSNNNASTKWYLECFPNGFGLGNASTVGIALRSPSANDPDFIDFGVEFRFGVVKKDGENEFVTREFTRELTKEDIKLGYGVERLLYHTNLFDESKGFVVDDTLTVVVELKVEYEGDNVEHLTEAARSSALNAKMTEDFKKMFENDDCKNDFELKASDGEVLKAHRLILAARSPVFYAMLKTDMKESKDGSVDVPDFDSTIMKELLRFIYCNEVEGLKQVAPKLVYAAEKYQLEELKNICLQEIISALEQQNVIDCLMIAHQVRKADELFEKCLDLIVSGNFKKVSQCAIWKNLPKKLMAKIIDGISKRAYTSNVNV